MEANSCFTTEEIFRNYLGIAKRYLEHFKDPKSIKLFLIVSVKAMGLIPVTYGSYIEQLESLFPDPMTLINFPSISLKDFSFNGNSCFCRLPGLESLFFGFGKITFKITNFWINDVPGVWMNSKIYLNNCLIYSTIIGKQVLMEHKLFLGYNTKVGVFDINYTSDNIVTISTSEFLLQLQRGDEADGKPCPFLNIKTSKFIGFLKISDMETKMTTIIHDKITMVEMTACRFFQLDTAEFWELLKLNKKELWAKLDNIIKYSKKRRIEG